MDVIFNLPNDVAFKVEMECVPRIGEEIYLCRIDERSFSDKKEWERFRKENFTKDYIVDKVIWSPMMHGFSYVNLILILKK